MGSAAAQRGSATAQHRLAFGSRRKQDRVHDVNAFVVDEMADEDTTAATTLPTPPHMHSHRVSAVCARGASEAQEGGAAKQLVPTGGAPDAEVTFSTLPRGSLPRLTIDATAEGDERFESR
jgi:hypothetical protein